MQSSYNAKVFLLRELEARRHSDAAYSLRRFAKDLGEDPSALSKLLRGKVEIGPRAIEKLGKALLLGWDEMEEFKEQARSRRRRARQLSTVSTPSNLKSTEKDYEPLRTDTFRIVSDWYHFAILELMELDDFESDATWISNRLNVPVPDVLLALERLEQVGLIGKNPNGKLIDKSSGWTTNIAQPFFDDAHRRMQKQILEKAIRALETKPLSRREQSTIILAFDSNRIQEAKQWIKTFRRKFNSEFGRGKTRDSVYHMSISLYPVTDDETMKKRKK